MFAFQRDVCTLAFQRDVCTLARHRRSPAHPHTVNAI
jgi:hypothetical protein